MKSEEVASFITSKLSYVEYYWDLGDIFLTPARFLWGGYKISVLHYDWVASNKIPSLFEKKWSNPFIWIKTALAILLVVPATLAALALKKIPYFPETRTCSAHRYTLFLQLQYNQWLQSLNGANPKPIQSHFSSLDNDACKILSFWLLQSIEDDSNLSQNKIVKSALERLVSTSSIQKEDYLEKQISAEVLKENSNIADSLLAFVINHENGMQRLAIVFESTVFRLLSNHKDDSEEIIYSLVNDLFEKFWSAVSQEQQKDFLDLIKKMDLQNLPMLFVLLQNRGLLTEDPQFVEVLHSYIENRFDFPSTPLTILKDESWVLWSLGHQSAPLKLSLKQTAAFLATQNHVVKCKGARYAGLISPLLKNVAKDQELTQHLLPQLDSLTAWILIGTIEPPAIKKWNLIEIVIKKMEALKADELLSLDFVYRYSDHHFSLLYQFCPEQILQVLAKEHAWFKELLAHLPDPKRALEAENRAEEEMPEFLPEFPLENKPMSPEGQIRRLLETFDLQQLLLISQLASTHTILRLTLPSYVLKYLIERIKPDDLIDSEQIGLNIFSNLTFLDDYIKLLEFFRGEHLWKITYFCQGMRQRIFRENPLIAETPNLLSISAYLGWLQLKKDLPAWIDWFRSHLASYERPPVPIFEESEEAFQLQIETLAEENFFKNQTGSMIPKYAKEIVQSYYVFLEALLAEPEVGPYILYHLFTKEERMLYRQQFPGECSGMTKHRDFYPGKEVPSLLEICLQTIVDADKDEWENFSELASELNELIQRRRHKRILVNNPLLRENEKKHQFN